MERCNFSHSKLLSLWRRKGRALFRDERAKNVKLGAIMHKTEFYQSPNEDSLDEEIPTLIVIDNESISRDLVQKIATQLHCKCKTFETAEQYLQQASITRPACLVIELSLPGMDGLELQQKINQMPVPIPVVMHTAQATVSSAVRSLENGAVAFIEKPSKTELLVQSISQAIEHDREQLVYHKRLCELSQVESQLDDRERKVIQGMLVGMLNKSIARKIDVSVRTVENVRSGLLQKFKANNSSELVSKYTELILLRGLLNRLKPAPKKIPEPHYGLKPTAVRIEAAQTSTVKAEA